MPNILIVDGQELFRDSLAALFERNGFHTVVANTAGLALTKFNGAMIDLVIMDVDLPAAQGLVFLQQLRQLPAGSKLPVIILTALVDKACILRAKGLGVREYFLKQALSADRLIERIRSLLGEKKEEHQGAPKLAAPVTICAIPKKTPVLQPPAKPLPSPIRVAAVSRTDTAQWPHLLTRDQTLEMIERITDGKTIAGVVSQVIAVASSPRADLSDLVRLIESDPILATRILQLSNSPAFASARGRVTSVEGAARNIGLKGIQNMALSIGIFRAFPPDERDGFNTVRCWQHSFAVAEIMTLLAAGTSAVDEASHHLVGLCHDLNAILLRQHFTPHYEQILEFAALNHLPLHAVECAALGLRQPELVARLLTHIGLPVNVVQTTREFYERETRGPGVTISQIARRLDMANQLAHGLLLAASTQDTVGPITRAEWRQIAGDASPPAFSPATKRNEIVASTNILARLPEKDEQRMVMPIAPKSAVRLWYLRPENFLELDPLAMALSFTSELKVSSKLPQGEEWLELDGLVIAGLRPGIAPLVPSDIVRACRAAGRSDLPVLCLNGQGDPPPDDGHITSAKFPISLNDLHHWMIGVEASVKPCEPARLEIAPHLVAGPPVSSFSHSNIRI
jgi:HD-like signal output (HDOD) protein/CheY-like chemotaxis protein